LKAVQNLIAQQEFVSIRVEGRSAANEGLGEAQSSSARHFAFFILLQKAYLRPKLVWIKLLFDRLGKT
jgi:hypothetical protein